MLEVWIILSANRTISSGIRTEIQSRRLLEAPHQIECKRRPLLVYSLCSPWYANLSAAVDIKINDKINDKVDPPTEIGAVPLHRNIKRPVTRRAA